MHYHKAQRWIALLVALATFCLPSLTAFAREESYISDPFSIDVPLKQDALEGQQAGESGGAGGEPSIPQEEPPAAQEGIDGRYIVTFETGMEEFTQWVDARTQAARPADPTPPQGAGSYFMGWYVGDAQTPYDFLTPVTADLTLTARYGGQHLVQFLGVRGMVAESVLVNPGEPVSPLEASALQIGVEHLFIHWVEEGQDPETPFDFSAGITRNVRLVPYLTDAVIVIFVSEGTQVEPQRIDPETPITRPDSTLMKRPGYTFKHWSTEPGGAKAYPFTALETKTTTLYAVWEAQKVNYTVVYWKEAENIEGEPALPADYMYAFTRTAQILVGQPIPMDAQTALTTISATATQTDRAYINTHFEFVQADQDVIAKGDGSSVINVYYKRKIHEVIFEFKTTAGSLGATAYYLTDGVQHPLTATDSRYIMKVKLDQNVHDIWPHRVDLANPKLPFNLWESYYNLNRDPFVTFTEGSYYNVISNFTINKNKGTLLMRASYLLSPHYVYRMYFLEVAGSPQKPEGWVETPGLYESFEVDGVLRYYEHAPIYGTESQQNNTTTTYKGWPGRVVPGYRTANLNKDGDHMVAPIAIYEADGKTQRKTAAGQLEYELHYYMDRNTYNVTLNAMGGTLTVDGQASEVYTQGGIGFESIIPGSLFALVPVKPNATFEGWFYDQGFKEPAQPGAVMPGQDVVLFAKYSSSGVKVTYLQARDSQAPLAVMETSPGGLVAYPQNGYEVDQAYEGLGVFKGWMFDLDGIPVQFSNTMPIPGDMTVYAAWGSEPISVTYYKDGAGSEVWAQIDVQISPENNTLAKNLIYPPANPPLPGEGYGFVGWYANPKGTGARFTAATVIEEDVSVYPVFAAPLALTAPDVHTNTNADKTAPDVSWWNDLDAAAVRAGLAVDTGHALVTTAFVTTGFTGKEDYPPQDAAGAGYAIPLTVTDSIGRRMTRVITLYVLDDTAPTVGGSRAARLPIDGTVYSYQGIFDSLIGQAALSDDYATAAQLYASLVMPQADIDFTMPGVYPIDYTVTDTVGNQTTVTVEVTLYIPTVDVDILKVWDDDLNVLEGRPAGVRIQLYRQTEGSAQAAIPVGLPVDLTGGETAGQWAYVYETLPACDELGNDYIYTVEELDVHPNYAASAQGRTLTNTLQTIRVEGQKVWDIQGSGYVRPAAVTVELYRSDDPDAPYATQSVSGSGDTWAFAFEGLLAYDADGEAYAYTLREAQDEIPAYIVAEVEDTTLTNTYGADVTLHARKEWDLAGAPAGQRPEAATLLLMRDGAEYARATVTAGDQWTASFDVPQIDYVGSAFTLEEEAVPGYAVAYTTDPIDGTLIATNTFIMPMLEITGTKLWDGTPDGYAAPAVVIDLLRDGEAVQSLQLPSGQTAIAFPEKVPQYDENGVAYAYTLSERPVPGYDSALDESGLHLTNTYNPTGTAFTVVGAKAVEGPGAPAEVFAFEMRALQDAPMPQGAKEGLLTLAAPAGALAFGEISFSRPGVYAYEIRESAGETRGFAYDDEVFTLTVTVIDDGDGHLAVQNTVVSGVKDPSPAGIAFTNVYTIPTEDQVVTLVWRDDEDALALRPDSASIQLMRTPAGGLPEAVGGPVTLTGGNWTATFADQPVHDELGRAYTYTAHEIGTSPNYSTDAQGLVITDTLVTTSATLTKAWDIIGTGFVKPAFVTFALWRTAPGLAQEELADAAIQVGGAAKADIWTQDITGLPAYTKEGAPYTYYAREIDAPFATTRVEEGLTVTNTYAADQQIPVAVTFDHTGSPSHPQAATLHLYRDGMLYATVTVNEQNGWAFTFEVPQVDYLNATFTLEQDVLPDYDPAYGGDAQSGFAVHNTFVMPLVEVAGGKTWQGIPATGVSKPPVTVYLYRDDAPGTVLASTLLRADDTYAFPGLDQYDPQGRPYAYTVSEGATPGFAQAQDGLNFTNTYDPQGAVIQVAGEKSIPGDTGYPADTAFTFSLRRLTAGAPMPGGSAQDVKTLSAPEGAFDFGSITYTQPGEYVYEIREEAPAPGGEVPGFAYDGSLYTLTVRVEFHGEDGTLTARTDLQKDGGEAQAIAFANRYATPTDDITATLIWADDQDALGLRPDSVQLQLMRAVPGGPAADVDLPVRITILDGWQYVFEDQPRHDEKGRPYTYSLREVGTSPNYATDAQGLVVTDTLVTTQVTLTKAWDIIGTGFEKPAFVTFALWRSAPGLSQDELAEAAIQVGGAAKADTWTQDITGLPAYTKEGAPYAYYARETDAPFATNPVESGLTVTNTYAADQRIDVSKVWTHTGSPSRPAAVTVRLHRDGALYASAVLKEGNGWAHTFEVPQVDYLNATFTLTEDEVPGYASAVTGDALTGFTVHNAYVMPLDEITGTKAWKDVPDSVTIPAVSLLLYRDDDGEHPYRTLALQSGQTAYSFTGLPRYDDDGRAYVYTVLEDTPKGYTCEKTGTADFVNTYAPRSVGFAATAQKILSGDSGYPANTPFSFTLRATGKGETHPLPTGAVQGIKTVSCTGQAALAFGEMTFTRPGTYLYEVAEVLPAQADQVDGFTYDDTVYELMLEVDDVGGDLRIAHTYRVKGGAEVDAFVFDNAYATPTQDFTVTKEWKDQEDALGLRPAAVQVQLMRATGKGHAQPVGAPEILSGPAWTYTYKDQPVHDPAGQAYAYSIQEVDVDAHYTAAVRGFTLVNTLKPAALTARMQATPLPAAQGTVPVVNAGDGIRYQITLENTGGRKLYDTRVMDTLPAGVTADLAAITPAPDAVIQRDGRTTLMWKLPVIDEQIGEIPGSLDIVIPVTVDPLQPGEASRLMENRVYVRPARTANEPLPLVAGAADDPAGYTATETVAHQLISLSLSADVPEGQLLAEGAKVRYTVTLHNAAPLAGIEIYDVLPAGLSYVPGSLDSSLHPAAGNAYHSGGRIALPRAMVPGATGATFSFSATVDTFTHGYELTLTNQATAVATVHAAAPAVTLTTDALTHTATRREVFIDRSARLLEGVQAGAWTNGTQAAPVQTALGQVIEYQVTVTSAGYLPADAAKDTRIQISDLLEPNLALVEGSVDQSVENPLGGPASAKVEAVSRTGGTQGWLISDLAPGEVITLTYQALAPATTGADTALDLVGRATMVDLGRKGLTTASGGLVYPAPSEWTRVSAASYHRITEAAVSALKGAEPAGYGRTVAVQTGDVVTYSILVRNTGHAQAQHVRVMDILPQGVALVPGSLAANGEALSDGVHAILPTGMGLTPYVTTGGGETALFWIIDSLQGGKNLASPGMDTVTLTFQARIVAENQGELLRNVAYTLVPDLGAPVPGTPAGPEDPAGYTPTPAPVDYQTFSFTADSDPAAGGDSAAAATVVQGGAITYTLTLRAGAALEGVIVTDTLAPGLTLVPGSIRMIPPTGAASSIPDSALSGGMITWPKADVAAGETRFTFTVIVDKLPEGSLQALYQNRATVSLDNGATGPDQKTLTRQVGDLFHRTGTGYATLTLQAALVGEDGVALPTENGTPASPATALRGGQIEYTLVVAYTAAPGYRSGELVVTDLLPAGTTLVPGSIRGLLRGESGQVVSMQLLEDTVQWALQGLTDGESATLSFRVLVPATLEDLAPPASSFDMVNGAALLDKGLEGLTYALALPGHPAGAQVYDAALYALTSNTTYHRAHYPVLSARKESDLPAGRVAPGAEITYTITLRNDSAIDARQVLVRDKVPAGMTYVPDSITADAQGVTMEMRDIGGELYATWIVPSLAAGQEVRLGFTAGITVLQDTGIVRYENIAEYREGNPAKTPQEQLENLGPASGFYATNPVGGHYQSRGGQIEIKKIDADDKTPLAGAEFTLVQLSSVEAEDRWQGPRVLTSDDLGRAVFEDVPAGKYVVYESEAPEGYIASEIQRSVNISAADPNRQITVPNSPAESVLGVAEEELVGIGNRNVGLCKQ